MEEDLTVYSLARDQDRRIAQESIAEVDANLQDDEHLVRMPTRLYYPLLEAVAVLGVEDLISLLGKLGAPTITTVHLEVEHRPMELTIPVGARRPT